MFCQMLQEKCKDTCRINSEVLNWKSMKLYSHTAVAFRGTTTQLALSDKKIIKNFRTVTISM